MNQKILVIVNEKTSSLKLMTRNFKNVELISASNLNTLSLLKAKYILITILALSDIQEIHCNDE
jgi:ribosomal protein L4